MKHISFPLKLLFILVITSCHDDADMNSIGCCDQSLSIKGTLNDHIYIPNIFTPNGDGINDTFFIRGDSIRTITNFEIRDKFEEIVFLAKHVDYLNQNIGWDGNVNGKIEKGKYAYSATIETLDGSIGIATGNICNYPCTTEVTFQLIDRTDCRFDHTWLCLNSQWLDCYMSEDPGCFN